MKKKRVLIGLTKRSFNRFEAERLLADHVLPQTVSALQKRHGIQINRKWETIAGYQGFPTRVCRYWVAPEFIELALKKVKSWA